MNPLLYNPVTELLCIRGFVSEEYEDGSVELYRTMNNQTVIIKISQVRSPMNPLITRVEFFNNYDDVSFLKIEFDANAGIKKVKTVCGVSDVWNEIDIDMEIFILIHNMTHLI